MFAIRLFTQFFCVKILFSPSRADILDSHIDTYIYTCLYRYHIWIYGCAFQFKPILLYGCAFSEWFTDISQVCDFVYEHIIAIVAPLPRLSLSHLFFTYNDVTVIVVASVVQHIFSSDVLLVTRPSKLSTDSLVTLIFFPA